jgi:hypothetical protein
VHAELTWQATFGRDSIAYIPLMDANSLWLGTRKNSARADHITRVRCIVPAKGAAATWSNCHPIIGAPRTRTYTTRKHTWMNEQGSVHPSLRPVWAAHRDALVASRTLLRVERAYRPRSRPSLLLLAWKRVIRARGGLNPQRPSSRPPSALGWVTSDEWPHGWSTSTARAPRRQRRPRRPTHPHWPCAPWSTCSLPIAGDCASSVPRW